MTRTSPGLGSLARRGRAEPAGFAACYPPRYHTLRNPAISLLSSRGRPWSVGPAPCLPAELPISRTSGLTPAGERATSRPDDPRQKRSQTRASGESAGGKRLAIETARSHGHPIRARRDQPKPDALEDRGYRGRLYGRVGAHLETQSHYPYPFCDPISLKIALDSPRHVWIIAGMANGIAIRVTTLRCTRCGCEWMPRRAVSPRRCPNHACRSTLWHRKPTTKKERAA